MALPLEPMAYIPSTPLCAPHEGAVVSQFFGLLLGRHAPLVAPHGGYGVGCPGIEASILLGGIGSEIVRCPFDAQPEVYGVIGGEVDVKSAFGSGS